MTDHNGSVCPGCAVGCGIRIAGSLQDVAGRSGGAVNSGGAICEHGERTGTALVERRRILQPHARIDGTLQPVSWTQALNTLESGFGALEPTRVGFLGAPRATNEANYLLQKLARCFGSNHVDHRARLCHDAVAAVCERRLGASTTINSLADLHSADAVFVVGANPAHNQPIAFERYCLPDQLTPRPLIAVDPATTETTDAADIAVHPVPGTDYALLTALCALVVDNDWTAESFIDRHTTGVDRFVRSLQDVSVADLCATAGVTVETTRRIARTVASVDRCAFITATGIGRCDRRDAPAAERLVDLLLATGNAARRGAGLTIVRGVTNEQGALDMGVRPDWLPGGAAVGRTAARKRVASVWGVTPPAGPGLTEREQLTAISTEIDGLYVVGENPAVVQSGPSPALEELDWLVVQDPFFTETHAYADLVLPAATWAETSGTVTNLERRIQLRRPVSEQPATVGQDWEILSAVGRRLTDGRFDHESPQAVFEEITRVCDRYSGVQFTACAQDGVQWPTGRSAVDVLRDSPFPFGTDSHSLTGTVESQ